VQDDCSVEEKKAKSFHKADWRKRPCLPSLLRFLPFSRKRGAAGVRASGSWHPLKTGV
jgi:hypothetical protein